MTIYKNILVPLDGSLQADKAFHKSLKLALTLHANITLVHIVDTRVYQSIITYDPILAENAKKEAEDALQEYIQKGKDMGIPINATVQFGNPREMISFDIPQKYHCDLIMMGATGMSALERMVIGSVSDYVSKHAICDVSIIR